MRASPAFFFLYSPTCIQYNQKSGEKLERPGKTYEVNASGRHEVDVRQGEGPHSNNVLDFIEHSIARQDPICSQDHKYSA